MRGTPAWATRFGSLTLTQALRRSNLASAQIPHRRKTFAPLMGVSCSDGQTVYVCTGRRLYASSDAITWNVVHDFGEDVALTATLSPNHSPGQTIYALLLGGTFWRGIIPYG